MQKNGKIIILCVLSALVIFSAVAFYQINSPSNTNDQVKTFTSYAELSSYVTHNMAQAQSSNYPVMQFYSGKASVMSTQQASGTALPAATYSTTNIQIQGVDEADTVKTDGSYLYVVSGDTIYIIQAQPAADAQVVSKIQLNDSYNSDIYVNGNRLVVLVNQFLPYAYPLDSSGAANGNSSQGQVSPGSTPTTVSNNVAISLGMMPPIWGGYSNVMSINIYDISNKSSPVLVKDIQINGTFSGSRMIGDFVYVVSNEPAQPYWNSTVVLPTISDNGTPIEIKADEVSYTDVPATSYDFVTVLAIDVANDSAAPTFNTFLASASSAMYASQDSIYLTIPNYAVQPMVLGGPVTLGSSTDETIIYRLGLNGANVTLEAQGSVPGSVLDQYSMDEYNGNFRIATTEWTPNGTVNNVFVLDQNLNILGSLQGIAPGESIYSAMFMGDRCYLVTYQQVDPFYVIDLSNAASPQVLGYLNIPGVTNYLYPYDQNTVLGVGAENSNLQLSLFDVTDVTAPRLLANYTLQATWSYTEASYDHKAFLFDQSESLLVLPVSMGIIGQESVNWQGALVFNLTKSDGFVLKGTITHIADVTEGSGNSYVTRALYINNTLYTISPDLVKLNDLSTLAQLNEVPLS
jgi:inhibitor of cysteine peptidase